MKPFETRYVSTVDLPAPRVPTMAMNIANGESG